MINKKSIINSFLKFGTIIFLLTGQINAQVKKISFDENISNEQEDKSTQPGWVKDGKIGGALKFDGLDDEKLITLAPDEQISENESFTIEMWVKPLKQENNQRMSIATVLTDKGFVIFRLHSKGRIGVIASGNKRGRVFFNVLSAIDSIGGWHHVAFVRDCNENMLRFYFDYKLVKEINFLQNINQINVKGILLAGASRVYKNFNGLIDEVIITKAAKRTFHTKEQTTDNKEYIPSEAKVEIPDKDVKNSWEVLKNNNISFLPAPKHITIKGKNFKIDNTWKISCMEEKAKVATDLFNERLTELGTTKLEYGDSGKNLILVGTFDSLKDILTKTGHTEKPPRQGYIIDSLTEKDKNIIILAGADIAGTRYACISLSMLLKKDGELLNTEIIDWPDYKYRMSLALGSIKNIQYNKNIIDYAFRAKLNMIWGKGFYESLEGKMKNYSYYREVNDYAVARGIRIVVGGGLGVGEAPYPKDMRGKSKSYYPYKTEEGLLGYFGKAYSWSRDDLIDKRGEEWASFVNKTGINTLYLHSMDTGGRDNPENWLHRTPMDKERWGDDRAAADANLINRIYLKIKKNNPDAKVFYVAYPYGGSYLEYPELKKWLNSLSKKSNDEMFFCVREAIRPQMELWMKNSPGHGRLIYHNPYPWSLGLMFSTFGRFAKTFYFDDKDIYWFHCGPLESLPSILCAAEYSWNTKAPGWGWLPQNHTSTPVADSAPDEILEDLLLRITGFLFGDDAADDMMKVYTGRLFQRLASNTRDLTIPAPLNFFKSKYDAAQRAVKYLDIAESKISPSSRELFNQVKKYVIKARHLIEARYKYFLSRQLLADEKYTEAEQEILEAKQSLLSLPQTDPLVKGILDDLNIASDIKWRRERKKYIASNRPQKNISVGIYSRGDGFYEGVQSSLAGIPQISVYTFDDPNAATLKKFDTIIFPATRYMWDMTEDWRITVRDFVEKGGTAIFSHNAIGRVKGSDFGRPIFPEICLGYGGKITNNRTLTNVATNQIIGNIRKGDSIEHEYNDHLYVKKGGKAEVIFEDAFDNPVMVTGKIGKGYVVYTGQIFGLTRDNKRNESTGDEWKILYNMIKFNHKNELK